MTTETTVFRFRSRYIVLEDLERLYSEGKIRPDDEIEIARNREGFFVRFQIKALIDLYGTTFPFRREKKEDVPPETTSSDHLGDPERVPSSEIEKMNGELPPPMGYRKKTENGECFVFMDFPLFNVDNEPDADRITGEEVVEELQKLRSMLPLQEWTPAHSHYFYFVRRNGNRTPLCRLCNNTPYGPQLFFKHLFSREHERRLSCHMVSRSSFVFWKERIGFVGQRSSAVQSKPQKSTLRDYFPEWTSFDRIPLLDPEVAEDGVTPTSRQLEFMRSMKDLLTLHPKQFFGKESVFGMFLASIPNIPRHCGPCDKIIKSDHQLLAHIFSVNHLNVIEKLKIKPVEFQFWYNIRGTVLSKKNFEDIVKIFTNNNEPPIPLLDFQFPTDMPDSYNGLRALNDLGDVWKGIQKDEFDKKGYLYFFDRNPGVKCAACDLPPGSFTSRSQLVEHILSPNHSFLFTMFGCSWEEPVQTWDKMFKGFLKSVHIGQLKESRVPLLHTTPENSSFCKQAIFVSSYQMMLRLFEQGGEILQKKAEGNSVHWKCEFCSTPVAIVLFSDELAALKHIFSQSHKEKMKFKAPKKDFDLWIERLLKLKGTPAVSENTKKSVKENTSAQFPAKKQANQVEKTQRRQQIANPSSSSQKVDSRVFRNNPRVALLDVLPPKIRVAEKSWFQRQMQETGKLFKKWPQEIRELAKAQKVEWVCAYCNTGPFVNKLGAVEHIVSTTHHEAMGFSSSEADVKYWSRWVERMKTDSNAMRINILRASKTNEPRVPLLDVPSKFHLLLSQSKGKEEYYKIRARMSTVQRTPQLMKKTTVECLHCHGTGLFSSLWEVFHHVFNKIHFNRIMSMASAEDFEYWNNLLFPQLEQPQPTTQKDERLEEKKAPPVSLVRPLPPTAAPAPVPEAPKKLPTRCTLPLFARQLATHKQDLLYVYTIRFYDNYKNCWNHGPQPFLSTPTFCEFCNVDMTKSTLLEIMKHAFSIPHLQKLYHSGTEVKHEYFSHWIGELQKLHDYETVPPDYYRETEFGRNLVTIPKPKPNDNSPNFHGFTTYDNAFLTSFDLNAVNYETKSILISRFAACPECNEWILSISEIFEHYFSEKHFANIRRSGRTVQQSDVLTLLNIVRLHQKPDHRPLIAAPLVITPMKVAEKEQESRKCVLM